MTTLLPPNSTQVELDIEAATARLGAVGVPVRDLWSPDRCPVGLLPWLAWALSVDEWQSHWPVRVQRAVIAGAPALHRIKGTRAALKAAMAQAGYGDATVIEACDLPRLGRGIILGRSWMLGVRDTSWADFWIIVRQPINRAAADALAKVAKAVTPVRCRLRSITIEGVQYVLGRNVWMLGRAVGLGATYKYEELHG